MSSSSDSSEDENVERLRDALDVRFISDSLYSSDGKADLKIKEPEKPKPLPSNRPVPEEFVTHHLKVTPEFQSFVSKQLSKFLDEQIKEVKKKKPKSKTEPDGMSGIYLLRNSKSFLSSEEPDHHFIPTKRCRRKEQHINCTEEDMLEVVVSPEWVLNGEGTKGWQRNAKKSPLFSYKKNEEGVLELISETSRG